MTDLIAKTAAAASVLVDTLVSLGADTVFGYPGAAILSIYNELSQAGRIKHYLVRHEQAAVHAAEGYARVSGQTGIALVTSGPGFTNTITGIANAYADSTPIVVLAGDVSTEKRRGKVFQNVNMVQLAEACSKKCYVLSEKDDIAFMLKDAFHTANTGKRGPVVIVLPRNLLEADYVKPEADFTENPVQPERDYNTEKFTALINSAQKPLVLVGGGCINAADEVRDFAARLGCPVVSTLMGIGVYPSEDLQYLGMIGINGSASANAAINECDLLIALGTSFSNRSVCNYNGKFMTNAKIININIDSFENDFELNINCDVKEFMHSYLAEGIDLTRKKREMPDFHGDINLSRNETLNSAYVLKTIFEYTKSYEPIVVTDVGQHQMLAAQFFNFNKPKKFITSGGLGTMGFGLPAAIGACIAKPDNLVMNITGDGSFQMNLQELAVCKEHNIPIKIIIMNNGCLGMVRQMQDKLYNKRYQVQMTNPDFTQIAKAYGLHALRAANKDELIPALNEAVHRKETVIIDIKTDPFEDI